MVKRDPWWERAACRDVDPRIFDAPVPAYSHDYKKRGGDRWWRARAVCAGCPVIMQCLEFTLAEEPAVRHSGGDVPFAAGLTPDEIERLRERRRRRKAS